MTDFANQVLDWFHQHGRHDLPWQHNPTPYRVWVSEIMLQQTQVSTVIPYYLRFMEWFPTVEKLGSAPLDQVLHLWTGLGYYARARNLHKTAIKIATNQHGNFPTSVEALMELDGIGQSTAGAIAAIAMQIRAPILDGNVKRVLTRYKAIGGWPEQASIKRQLWELTESLTPQSQVAQYTQAMMDLGATMCTRSNPACQQCPLRASCLAFKQGNTTDYPRRKPRKALPVRSVTFFIVQNPLGDVLLEKRPPTGIWGGLWSLPEGKNTDEVFELKHCSIENTTREQLPGLRHTFSHFHLDITPIKLRARQINDEVAESDRWLWYPLDQSTEVGLAAPVKKLLTSLTE
jgi:A/G-specific adenine glycosylase